MRNYMEAVEEHGEKMNGDTVRLLRECNAGIKMGVNSLDDVLDNVEADELKIILKKSKDAHCRLGDETNRLLSEYNDDGKEPNMMAKMMSRVKSNVMTMGEHPDRHIADVITDGCNMGVKSLARYLNQYPAADERARQLTGRIIEEEKQLINQLQVYL